jgi:D-hydroxyproline dehydrogenase subunit gamma
MSNSADEPPAASKSPNSGLFIRVKPRSSALVRINLNGQMVDAHVGDTLLTAILLHSGRIRYSEFGGAPRAGYCLMGACQDCWIGLVGQGRVRACTTLVTDGMVVNTVEHRND